MADAAAALQGLQRVLETCGITPEVTHTQFINNEGLTSIANLGLLDGDNDVLEMAKCMVTQTEANGCVNLGTIAIKKLQALVYWIKDCQMHSLEVNADDWDEAAMMAVMDMKCIWKELKDNKKLLSVKGIVKFNPDRYEMCEDAFLNLLSQTIGMYGEPLWYVVHDEMPPYEFENDDEKSIHTRSHMKVKHMTRTIEPCTWNLRNISLTLLGILELKNLTGLKMAELHFMLLQSL